jgi:hypothetical protein
MEASLDVVSTEDVWSGFEDLGWRARSVGPVLSPSASGHVSLTTILPSSAGGGMLLARTQKEELGWAWA